MGKAISLHVNQAAAHQVEFAGYLAQGFRRLGHDALVTSELTDSRDVHVVIGPNYAKRENLGKRCIMVDRCFWGDHRAAVTLAWMNPDGGRVYPIGVPDDRPRPELLPWKRAGVDAVYLFDYGDVDDAPVAQASQYYQVERRQHPFVKVNADTLGETLARNDVAIGKCSSAMVAAAVAGLAVVALDHRSPVRSIASSDPARLVYPDRTEWLKGLSYMNWTAAECASGAALDFILCR